MVCDPIGSNVYSGNNWISMSVNNKALNSCGSDAGLGSELDEDEELLDVESGGDNYCDSINAINMKELIARLGLLKTYVIEPLYRHPKSAAFRKPVNPILLGIPDYPKMITHPMDLGTVRENIRIGAYISLSDCLHDLDLIWKNAKKFNPPQHFIHQIAEELEQFMQEKLNKMDFKKCKYLEEKGNRQIRYKKKTLGHFLPKDPMVACQEIIFELLNWDIHRAYSYPFKDCGGKGRLNLQTLYRRVVKRIYVHPGQLAGDFRRMISLAYGKLPSLPGVDTMDELLCSIAAVDSEISIDSKIITLAQLASQLQHKFEVMYARRVSMDTKPPPNLSDPKLYTQTLLRAQNSLLSIQHDIQNLFKSFYAEKTKRKKETNHPPHKKIKISEKQAWSREEIMALQNQISLLDESLQQPILTLMFNNGEKVTEDQDGYAVLDIEEASHKSLQDIKSYISRVASTKLAVNAAEDEICINSESNTSSSTSSDSTSDSE